MTDETYFDGSHITESELRRLRDAYDQYGTALAFWDTYDEILKHARIRTANAKEVRRELQLAAVKLGAVSARR